MYSDTTPDFDAAETFFTVGALLIISPSGNSMIARANTESDETLSVEINNDDGQTLITRQWVDFTDSLTMPTEFAVDFAE